MVIDSQSLLFRVAIIVLTWKKMEWEKERNLYFESEQKLEESNQKDEWMTRQLIYYVGDSTCWQTHDSFPWWHPQHIKRRTLPFPHNRHYVSLKGQAVLSAVARLD